jgi:DNA-binding response OmpR family regulator
MHELLLIEDDEALAQSLKQGLLEEGYGVTHVATAGSARLRLAETVPNLALLDLGLPDGDGLELLKELETCAPDVPVIILTARGGVMDRVSGLDGGAMDYMVKPFALAELKARIRLHLRKSRAGEGLHLQAGGLHVDVVRRRVQVGDDISEFPPREFDLLTTLMRFQGYPVSREQIGRFVWNSPRRMSSLDNLIDVHVSRLRERLKELNADVGIRTIRGVGYQLDKEDER